MDGDKAKKNFLEVNVQPMPLSAEELNTITDPSEIAVGKCIVSVHGVVRSEVAIEIARAAKAIMTKHYVNGDKEIKDHGETQEG